MILPILFSFFFLLLHCQQSSISISLSRDEIQFKGNGAFTNFDQIRELFFLSRDYRLNFEDYEKRELALRENTLHCKSDSSNGDSVTGAPYFAEIDVLEGKDLIEVFDSMAVLVAFDYFGLDFDGKNQWVTGAVYDLVGLDQLDAPIQGKVIGEPILMKGRTLTVHVYFRPSDQIGARDFKPRISGKFLMVKKGEGGDLKVPLGNPPVREGNEFKALKQRFSANESNSSCLEPTISFQPRITNIYNTIFGGYLMNTAFKIVESEANWGVSKHAIVLEVGMFMNPVAPNVTVNAFACFGRDEIWVYFMDLEGEIYCKFMFCVK